MAGYVIANYRVTDPDGMKKYLEVVRATLSAHGAEVLAADYNSLSIEGDAPPTTIVLRFASVEAARGWYDSPEYQAIKDLRIDNSGEGRLVIAESFAPRAEGSYGTSTVSRATRSRSG
jgi:uncharacterized protein (DUF1330 family)